MRKHCLILMLGILVVPAAGLGAALDPGSMRLLPSDVDLLFGMEWRRMLDSPQGDAWRKQLREADLRMFPPLALFQKTLLEDVDALVIAGIQERGASAAKPGRLFVVVKGRFDRDRVREWLPGKIERYRRFELITPANVQPPTARAVVVDAQTVVFAQRKDLVAAMDRLALPARAAVPTPFLERAANLARRYDLWLAADVPSGGSLPPGPEAAELFSHVSAVDFGVSFSSGAQLLATWRAKSEQDAVSLASTLQGLLSMAAAQKPEQAEILGKIEVKTQFPAVTLSLSLTEAEVQQALERDTESRKKTALAGAPAGEPTKKASGPRSIRITGLDQGMVQIPVPGGRR